MDEQRTIEASRIGDMVAQFVERLTPVHSRYDSVTEALESLLPANLRAHCRIGSISNGCLKVVADGSSYMFELQLCKAVLLRELQRLFPGARIRRIEVGMLR
jgi:hypothetical protein